MSDFPVLQTPCFSTPACGRDERKRKRNINEEDEQTASDVSAIEQTINDCIVLSRLYTVLKVKISTNDCCRHVIGF